MVIKPTKPQDVSPHASPMSYSSYLPPGTSKWNKIDYRLFLFITQNWRGKPLVSHRSSSS
jgi:Rhodopirellula transposase DDE domain